MKIRFSIRYKFLFVTTLLLVLCVGAYLGLATSILKGDKTELVYDYNRSAVSNMASDIDTYFRGVADKIKLIAFFFNEKQQRSMRIMSELLDNDAEIVFVGASNDFEVINTTLFTNSSYLETYGISTSFFLNDLRNDKPVPFDRIRLDGEAVWNATVKDGPPLIGLGRSVVEETELGVPIRQYAVISFLRADKMITALSRGNLSEIFVANDHGELLVHPNKEKMIFGVKTDILTKKAIDHPLGTSVLPEIVDGEKVLGAFSKAFNKKLVVISRVSESRAFGVIYHLIYRSLFFALIVVTAAFIVAILFSRSLTRPLETLIGGMDKVAQGDLDTQIKVKTRDEISVLADSFNRMICDLKSSREELEHINSELENKVKDRTRQLELQNQAVKKAQEALLRTTRLAAVGEIAGRAAHEVLNPLTGIMSRIQKIQLRLQNHQGDESAVLKEILAAWSEEYKAGGFDGLLDSWKKKSQLNSEWSLFEEDLENIKAVGDSLTGEMGYLSRDIEFLLKECQRINRIVQSMRSLSVVKGDSKPHSVKNLVRESVHIMADLASQMDAEIRIMNFDNEYTVMVDEDEFIQSMTNILRNALQATKAQGLQKERKEYHGIVEVFVNEQPEKVAIHVKDNGVGIEAKYRSKLFETQFSTKPRDEGTGLGLNISRRFIRAFGGDIFLLQSEQNMGTEFVIELPLEKRTSTEKVSA